MGTGKWVQQGPAWVGVRMDGFEEGQSLMPISAFAYLCRMLCGSQGKVLRDLSGADSP